jgi:hypothetical protein
MIAQGTGYKLSLRGQGVQRGERATLPCSELTPS